ncbi:Molybdenum cofactor synthesis protein 3 [Podochytrium sp. JEL0797]|nr:Molybdenum cofactor synthesis protein 3 [Podochytrium sp. JEL0797]
MTDSPKLTKEEIERYSRQLLLPEIATQGQIKLRNSKVLLIGAGGLGSPSALYLAAAGVGKLGILDYDEVEVSNLHRQIIHNESRVGVSKSESARESIKNLNSMCECVALNVVLDSSNAMEVVKEYDVVLDCSDNVATRYLLNDVCVLSGKVLVSGSALRMDGQLTVYNYNNGPCYRCIFPTPPPPETVRNCSESGVLGVVPGIIGCFQALEAIKIITGMGPSYAQKMLLFDGIAGSMRVVKLRGKSAACLVCGENPSITAPIDYVQFCGRSATDKAVTQFLLGPEERVSVEKYDTIQKQKTDHILLDVRDTNQFSIASIPNSVNIPWSQLPRRLGEVFDLIFRRDEQSDSESDRPVYVLCRLGNDSQLAVKLLQASGIKKVWDIEGGLSDWSDRVDTSFPKI